MSARQPQRRTDHTKEIYGILFLAVGSFVGLCLYSFHPLDPSLSSVGTHEPIRNLGGFIGSYLSDLLYMLLGVAAYFLPALFMLVAFSYFALRPIRPGWSRALAYLAFTSLAAVFCQLVWGQITLMEHPLHAGGLIGWLLTTTAIRFLGVIGTYLFTIAGMILAILWLTEVSLAKLTRAANALLSYVSRTVFAGLGFLARRSLTLLLQQLRRTREGWQASRARAAARKKDVQPADPEMEHLRSLVKGQAGTTKKKVVVASPHQAPAKASATASPSGKTDPRVLPRKDTGSEKRTHDNQLRLITTGGSYEMPQLSYLDSGHEGETRQVDETALKANASILEKKLLDFGVEGQVVAIHPGPVITMYEFEPAPGVKVNKIVNLSDDLSVTMGGKSVRIVPHLPGKAAIGIEIPNSERETVWLRDTMADPKFQRSDSPLTLALGKDSEGNPMVADLAKMPHLLVAGATGSGKSVSINTMICSILYKATPEQVRLILVDPKMLELAVYDSIPHMMVPVVTDPKKANQALRWAVQEMERRYHMMADAGIRNITSYNKLIEEDSLDKDRVVQVGREEYHHDGKMPFIVIIIDELADLMMVCSKELEDSIMRLAQKARASGIHLILATQRPSVDVITGVIKANFPTRISFKVSSRHDSRTILDQIGSERLLGDGDMLYAPPNAAGLTRVHGAFVTDAEIHRVAAHLKKQGKPAYRKEILQAPPEDATGGFGGNSEEDELYDQAVALVAQTRQASISMIQRHLRIGYNRAARMIERMESEGVVGPANGSKPREILVQNLAEEG